MTARGAGPPDEFGWVAGWSGRTEFEGVPDFQSAVAEPVAAPPVKRRARVKRSSARADPGAVTAPSASSPLVADSMVAALDAALALADVAPEHAAAIALARVLAKSVDAGKYQHAPKLLSVMTSLGLAPATRPAARLQVPAPQEEAAPAGAASAAVLARIRDRRAGKAVPEAGRPSLLSAAEPGGRRLGRTVPRLFTPPAVVGPPGPCGCGCALSDSTSLGFELVDFAHDVLGIQLHSWQRWLFIHALELDAFGLFRFRTVLVLVGRQNGKTTAGIALALWRMLVADVDADEDALVLGTSTNLDYAKEVWEKAVKRAKRSVWSEFRKERRSNGEVTLETVGGSRYKIATASVTGGRSLSVLLLLLDELREHKTWAAWSASSKTTNAQPRGQKWAFSNAGDVTSVVLNHLRAVALAALGEEVPAEDAPPPGEELAVDESLFLAEWSGADKCDLDDREQWAQANPSMNRPGGILETTIAADLTTDPPDTFRTEVLCQAVPQLDTAIDMDAWKDGTDDAATMESLRGKVCLCIDVDPSGHHVTLVGAAVLSDKRVQVAVVDSWAGPNAVQEARAAYPAWRAQIRPRAFGWFPGGPAAALTADLKTDKQATPLNGEVAPAVCMGMAQQITSRRIIHNGDPLLKAQLAGAGKLMQGDKWRFVRLGGPSVDAAYALAGAVHLARTLDSARRTPGVRVVG